tara:strand:- start:3791 stop:4261 length:471 start_codon:yes stop_codon:yes gene_type:complete
VRGINKAIIIGTLGQDPEVKYTPNGKAVSTISVATNESWKDQHGQQQEKTEWHRLVLWDKTAELAGQYLKKGSQCYFEGKIATRKWQNKEGQDVYTTEIRVNNMSFMGGGNKTGGNSGQSTGNNQNLNNNGTPKTPQQMAGKQSEPDFDFDDEIPF